MLNKDSENSFHDLSEISKEELLDEFIKEKHIVSKRSTIKAYNSVLMNLLSNIYPNIDKNNLLGYLNEKKDKWSASTMKRNCIVLKVFLSFLNSNRYIKDDLASIILVPKRKVTYQFVPTDSDVVKLFGEIDSLYKDEEDKIRFKNIFTIYAETGFRLQELIGLDIEDIDFENNKLVLRDTKNGDDAEVVLNDRLVGLLKEHIGYFKIDKGPLIIGKARRRINKNVICDNLKKLVAKAGLSKNFSVHAFRRYFIDKMRRGGADINVIKEVARHKDINTTNGYCQVREEEIIRTLDIVSLNNLYSSAIESQSSLPVA